MFDKIKIVTDSTTSLSKEECENLGLICLETTYMLDEELHSAFDQEEVSLPDFYKKLTTVKKCSTGCINIDTFETCFEDLIKQGYKVIYLGLSAALSSTFSNAQVARNNLEEKYNQKLIGLIDTRCASYGSLIMIERVQELITEGKDVAEIEEIVNAEAKTISVAFVTPDLTFLYKSGRASAFESKLGKILKVVPIVYVSDDDAKLKARDKCIGMKLTLKRLKNDFVSYINNKKHRKCYLTSCYMDKEVEDVKNYIAEHTHIKAEDIKTGYIDKTLSCCCGPRTVAIFCL